MCLYCLCCSVERERIRPAVDRLRHYLDRPGPECKQRLLFLIALLKSCSATFWTLIVKLKIGASLHRVQDEHWFGHAPVPETNPILEKEVTLWFVYLEELEPYCWLALAAAGHFQAGNVTCSWGDKVDECVLGPKLINQRDSGIREPGTLLIRKTPICL